MVNSLDVLLLRSCKIYVFWVVRLGLEICQASETLQSIINDSRINVSVFVTWEDKHPTKAARFFRETAARLHGNFMVNVPGTDAPNMRMAFKRPVWSRVFNEIEEPGTRWVYACGPIALLDDVRSACTDCSEVSGQSFIYTFEEL